MAVIENLKERILKDDTDKANSIIDEAKAKADVIINSAMKKAEETAEESKAKAEKDGRDRKDRIISRAQLDARNSILKTKQELIDRVLSLTIKKIADMSNEEYSDFIEKLLLSTVETGDEEILFSNNDRIRIKPDLIDNINKKLESSGKKGLLKISGEARNISSGFILRRGGLEMNCSIESQIRTLRDSLEGEIANLLFEGR